MRPGQNSRTSPPKGHKQKKILLIRWKSIGDVVFTLPALRCLRSNFPDSHITYLTSPEFLSLVKSFSVADEILTVDRARLKRFYKGGIIELLNLFRAIARTRYDIVIDFQSYGETAWVSWLTRAPQRWGVVSRTSRAWAYTRAVLRDDKAHPVDTNLRCLAESGVDTSHPEKFLELPLENRTAAERLFLEFGLRSDRPTVFIQPFTSTPGKDWPLEKWLALARRLRSLEIQVVFGGGPADRARLEPAISDNYPVAAGTDLLTSCSLAARCDLVIGPDTGLLHMATAAGCRAVLIKHLWWNAYPYGHPDWVLTPREGRLQVADLTLEPVLAEILRVIGSVHGPESFTSREPETPTVDGGPLTNRNSNS
jgi:ADP-heptose:LPS heptosyltransferase